MCLLFPLQSGPLSMEFVSKSICTKKKKKKGAVKTIMNNSSFQGKLFPPEGRGKMRKDKIKTEAGSSIAPGQAALFPGPL